MNLSSYLLTILGFLVSLLVYKLLRRAIDVRCKDKGMLPPEPSGALPLIGHLHLLGAQNTLARTLAAMADQYGSIFTIWLGVHRAVVVSDPEAIKECLTTHDKVLSSRPRSSHGEYLSYNYAAFGFASYGSYWREMRKIVMLQLLSHSRLKSLRHVQVTEVNTLVKDLYSLCDNERNSTKAINISQWLERLTLNTITQMIAGKRYFGGPDCEDEEGKHIGKLMKEFMYISGVLVPSDLIPMLGWTNCFLGPVKTMKRVSKEFDRLMQSWIEEHKRKRLKEEAKDMDFIDVMLSVIKEDSFFDHPRENIIKATAMNLIIAGADTTSITLTWILSNLLNNKGALEQAQQEIDLKIGRQKWAKDLDIDNLVYLQAIVKETLRLYPPGPLSVPHEATEDFRISGYEIPKGTRLLMNLWKLHRNPEVWSNPDEFRPERFLTSGNAEVDVLGQNFELIPFGSGRRACPGMTFALQMLHLTLARLLQGFSIRTPMGLAVDMDEGKSITLPKATPLEVVMTPRLSRQLYDLL